MFINVISFVAGAALLQWQRSLPDPYLLWLIPLLLIAFLRFTRARMPCALLLGFLWAAFDAHLGVRSALPPELYARDVTIRGTISSLPERHDRRVAFEFAVDELEYRQKLFPSPGLIKLNWYIDSEALQAGDRWRLTVRLKPPHGFMNPAGFDYEGWLFHQGIRAHGYVREDLQNRRLGEGAVRFRLHNVRQHIRSVIERQLQQGKTADLIKALVIGDRSGVGAADWESFRFTGTNHLIAISGLHITIIGGVAYYLVSAFWRRIPWLALRLAAPKAAALGALWAGAGYAALAGFSIPTQRALIMLSVVTAGIILQAQYKSSRSLGLALLMVVLLDPAAVLSPGFWLSFMAVAVICIAVSYRTGQRRILYSWVGMQWFIGLGLAPALLIWQQQVPLAAPLVNMLAVPLFSLLIIPLALSGTLVSLIWPIVGYIPLVAADWLLDIFRTMLALIAQFPLHVSAPPTLSFVEWTFVVVGIILLLLPRGVPGRVPGLILLLPLVLHAPASTPRPGEFQFTLLDVGQGMAAVVQTQGHTLVYDAGPAYSQDFDAGSDILVPFLLRRGITRVERLILSNGDNDHQGGVAGLIGKIRVDGVLSGEAWRVTETTASACTMGMSWIWDGVKFSILHPGPGESWRGNNASCVLQVENAAGSVLITGDIESAAEQRLVDCCRGALKASVITIPHHASATSSTEQFVRTVDPEFALASTGFLNRYGFPRAHIVERWEAQGARVLDTALSGAIAFVFSPVHGIVGPNNHRFRARRYWTHLPEMNRGSY